MNQQRVAHRTVHFLASVARTSVMALVLTLAARTIVMVSAIAVASCASVQKAAESTVDSAGRTIVRCAEQDPDAKLKVALGYLVKVAGWIGSESSFDYGALVDAAVAVGTPVAQCVAVETLAALKDAAATDQANTPQTQALVGTEDATRTTSDGESTASKVDRAVESLRARSGRVTWDLPGRGLM